MSDAFGRWLLWGALWALLVPVLIGVGLATLAVNVWDRWRYS